MEKTRIYAGLFSLVRKVGLEPTRPFERWNLNPVRLPISPLPRSSNSLASFLLWINPDLCQHFWANWRFLFEWEAGK